MAKQKMKKNFLKILPYLILIVVTIFATKIVDNLTSTDEVGLDAEKKELLDKVEDWKKRFIASEIERAKIREENQILTKQIEAYEIENDIVISTIRDANKNRNFARLDSLGDDLLNRLRRRR